MGDRCFLEATLRRCDLQKFRDVTEWGDYFTVDDEDGDSAVVDGYIEEVNYGGDNELDTAAAAGIRFYGKHHSGDEYGPEMFCSEGKRRTALAVDTDGWACVHYDPETAKPADELGDKRRIKQFAVKLRQVKRFIKGKETDG